MEQGTSESDPVPIDYWPLRRQPLVMTVGETTQQQNLMNTCLFM